MNCSKGLKLVLLSSVLFAAACKVFQPKQNETVTIQEDLSKYLSLEDAISDDLVNGDKIDSEGRTIKVESVAIQPTYSSNKEANKRLEGIARKNKRDSRVKGYRVQIYSGTSRALADTAVAYTQRDFEYKVYLNYRPPHYDVKVGNFFSKLEVYQAYANLKNKFPRSIILETSIRM